ncbi:MAG: HDOD domain-containing protein [Shewanella sp.]
MAISVAGGLRPGKVIEIELRLYQQLILGAPKVAPTLWDDLDAALESDAHKLEVERQAILSRLEKQRQTRQVFEAVSAQLIATVSGALEHHLAAPSQVLASSPIDETQLVLLELLLAKQLDASRIRPLIEHLGWLGRDLTNMVNSPVFRARRAHSSEVQVTDIKLVMNYIGIENLRTIIPYLCLRNWLPSGNPKLLWTTRKLWRYSIVSGIAANALAKLNGADAALVYSGALFNQLGMSVVLSLSAQLFDSTWGTWLREASSSRDKEVYDAVLATEFPAQRVFEQVLNHGLKFNWQLLEQLNFEDHPLTRLLKELDHSLTYRQLSHEAAMVARASCYAKVLLLEEMRQIEPQEKRIMFDYYELTEQELLRLKAQNYRKLTLL